MNNYPADSGSYELLTAIEIVQELTGDSVNWIEPGKGFDDIMTVTLGRCKRTGQQVAVRRMNLDNCTNEMLALLQDELHISKLFHHPNILPYKATLIANNEVWIVTPFMAYGSAKDLMNTHFTDGLNEPTIAYILQGVLKALVYIHRMGYVHRSVQASHILISSEGQVYLSGLRSIFSMISHGQRLRVIHDFPKYSVKILPWLSPELLQQNLQGYDAKSDIYSLGITACELANGHVPFKNMPATQMLLEKLNGTVPCLLDTTTIPEEELLMTNSQSAVDSGIVESSATCDMRTTNGEQVQHPYNRTFSRLFHNFVELCLQREPEQRPSASALLNHSFVKQLKLRVVEVLPDLLRPVTPVTELEGADPHELRGMTGLVSSLDQLEVEDWDF